MTVEFKAENIDLLLKALDEAKIIYDYDKTYNIIRTRYRGIIINLNNQKITCRESDMVYVNQLKRKYSEVVLQEVAKKKRWLFKKQSETAGILRRY